MTEHVQESATPEPEAQPTVAPEEVSPEVFQEMYAETVGGEFPLETQANEQVEADSFVDEGPEINPVQAELDQLKQTIAYQQGQIQNLSQTTEGQTQPRTVGDAVREQNPEMSSEQADWLVNQVGTIAGPMIEGLKGQIEYLTNRQNQSDQQGVVNDFNGHVNNLMDSHGIEDDWTRKVMRHAIVNEGLERHGNQFSKDLATHEFIALNNERVERAQASGESYVQAKQGAERETPPVSGPITNSSAVESVRGQVRDPNNKKMDFRGDTMTEMVTKYLDAVESGADSALGGSSS